MLSSCLHLAVRSSTRRLKMKNAMGCCAASKSGGKPVSPVQAFEKTSNRGREGGRGSRGRNPGRENRKDRIVVDGADYDIFDGKVDRVPTYNSTSTSSPPEVIPLVESECSPLKPLECLVWRRMRIGPQLKEVVALNNHF